MVDELVVRAVFPQLAGVAVEDLRVEGGVLRVRARGVGREAACPACATVSRQVHGGYERRLADLPTGGRPVEMRVRMQRFCCTDAGCPRRTFVAQMDGLSSRYCRRTPSLRRMLTDIAVFLAGRPGVRLAARLQVAVSRSSMLRLLNDVPLPAVAAVGEVGIDDFAFRRGQNYGTLVIDMGSHRPIDVLPDRSTETTRDWLSEHLPITLICRDRAGAYAEAARTGAPDAVQVADRWHLWHNLAETVEKIVRRHRSMLTDPAAGPVTDGEDDEPSDERDGELVATQRVGDEGTATAVVPGRLVTRTIERHAAVHALLDAGRSLSAVGRELHLDLHTVRRYLRPLRAAGAPAPSPVPLPPTARQVTGWLTRRPQDLPDTDTAVLQAITARCPALAGHLRPGPRVRQDAHPAARRTARELDGPRRGRGRTRTTRVHGQPAP